MDEVLDVKLLRIADVLFGDKRWKSARVFANNAPDRRMVVENHWQGKPIADCGLEGECDPTDARLLASSPLLFSVLCDLVSDAQKNITNPQTLQRARTLIRSVLEGDASDD